MSAAPQPPPTNTLKQTNNDFNDKLKTHAESFNKVSWNETLHAITCPTPNKFKEYYDSLPYSLQRCITIRLGSDNYNHHIYIEFDQGLYEHGGLQTKIGSFTNFHTELNHDELQATSKLLETILPLASTPTKFLGINNQNEFIIETDDIYDTFNVDINRRIDALALKYIRSSNWSHNAYALYIEKYPDEYYNLNPIQYRIRDIAINSIFECPNCHTQEKDNISHISSGPPTDQEGFVCRTCGIAINLDYIEKTLQNLPPTAPRHKIKTNIENWIANTFTEQDTIDIRSELPYIGETNKYIIYENLKKFQLRDDATGVWIEPKADGPIIFYTLEYGFIRKRPEKDKSCQLCGYDKTPINSVTGAYYAEGSGVKTFPILICDNCMDETKTHFQTALKNSEKAPHYISKLI